MNHVLRALAISLLFATAAWAQTTSGSMSGTVVDEQKQVVPGATSPSPTNRTGEERRTVTNEVGRLHFPGLAPVPTPFACELDGFRPLEVAGNVVLANSRLARGAAALEVGKLTEAVSVTALGETVATTTTSHQAVLDLKQVRTSRSAAATRSRC